MAGSGMGLSLTYVSMMDFTIHHGSLVPFLPFIAGFLSCYTEKTFYATGFSLPVKAECLQYFQP